MNDDILTVGSDIPEATNEQIAEPQPVSLEETTVPEVNNQLDLCDALEARNMYATPLFDTNIRSYADKAIKESTRDPYIDASQRKREKDLELVSALTASNLTDEDEKLLADTYGEVWANAYRQAPIEERMRNGASKVVQLLYGKEGEKEYDAYFRYRRENPEAKDPSQIFARGQQFAQAYQNSKTRWSKAQDIANGQLGQLIQDSLANGTPVIENVLNWKGDADAQSLMLDQVAEGSPLRNEMGVAQAFMKKVGDIGLKALMPSQSGLIDDMIKLKNEHPSAFYMVLGMYADAMQEKRNNATPVLDPMIAAFTQGLDSALETLKGPADQTTSLMFLAATGKLRFKGTSNYSKDDYQKVAELRSIFKQAQQSPDGSGFWRKAFDTTGTLFAQTAMFLATKGAGTFLSMANDKYEEMRGKGHGVVESVLRGAGAGGVEVATEYMGGNFVQGWGKRLLLANRFTAPTTQKMLDFMATGKWKGVTAGLWSRPISRAGISILSNATEEMTEEFMGSFMNYGVDNVIAGLFDSEDGQTWADTWDDVIGTATNMELWVANLMMAGVALPANWKNIKKLAQKHGLQVQAINAMDNGKADEWISGTNNNVEITDTSKDTKKTTEDKDAPKPENLLELEDAPSAPVDDAEGEDTTSTPDKLDLAELKKMGHEKAADALNRAKFYNMLSPEMYEKAKLLNSSIVEGQLNFALSNLEEAAIAKSMDAYQIGIEEGVLPEFEITDDGKMIIYSAVDQEHPDAPRDKVEMDVEKGLALINQQMANYMGQIVIQLQEEMMRNEFVDSVEDNAKILFEQMPDTETYDTITKRSEEYRQLVADKKVKATDTVEGSKLTYGDYIAMKTALDARIAMVKELSKAQREAREKEAKEKGIELPEEEEEEVDPNTIFRTNAYRQGQVLSEKNTRTIIRYAKGKATSVELMEEVFEAAVWDMAQSMGINEGEVWNTLGQHVVALQEELERQGYQNPEIEKAKEGLDTHWLTKHEDGKYNQVEVVEALGMLARSKAMANIDRLNLPKWLKDFMRLIQSWLQDCYRMLKIGQALNQLEKMADKDQTINNLLNGAMANVEGWYRTEDKRRDDVNKAVMKDMMEAFMASGAGTLGRNLLGTQRLIYELGENKRRAKIKAWDEEDDKRAEKRQEQINAEQPTASNYAPDKADAHQGEAWSNVAEASQEPKTLTQDVQEGRLPQDKDYQRIVWVPVNALELSEDVPQFKRGEDGKLPDKNGLVAPMATFDTRVAPPIHVWHRLNGAYEVISGRHRLEARKRQAKKEGKPDMTIMAYVYEEADGFDVEYAKTLDIELNIAEGTASDEDIVRYIYSQKDKATMEELKARNLGREDGKSGKGLQVGLCGIDNVRLAFLNGNITIDQAYVISQASDPKIQMTGLRQAQLNRTNHKVLAEFLNGVTRIAEEHPEQMQEGGDLFGNDTALESMERRAEFALNVRKNLNNKLALVLQVQKLNKAQDNQEKANILSQLGLSIGDKAEITNMETDIRKQLLEWENWWSNPQAIKLAEAFVESGLTIPDWEKADKLLNGGIDKAKADVENAKDKTEKKNAQNRLSKAKKGLADIQERSMIELTPDTFKTEELKSNIDASGDEQEEEQEAPQEEQDQQDQQDELLNVDPSYKPKPEEVDTSYQNKDQLTLQGVDVSDGKLTVGANQVPIDDGKQVEKKSASDSVTLELLPTGDDGRQDELPFNNDKKEADNTDKTNNFGASITTNPELKRAKGDVGLEKVLKTEDAIFNHIVENWHNMGFSLTTLPDGRPALGRDGNSILCAHATNFLFARPDIDANALKGTGGQNFGHGLYTSEGWMMHDRYWRVMQKKRKVSRVDILQTTDGRIIQLPHGEEEEREFFKKLGVNDISGVNYSRILYRVIKGRGEVELGKAKAVKYASEEFIEDFRKAIADIKTLPLRDVIEKYFGLTYTDEQWANYEDLSNYTSEVEKAFNQLDRDNFSDVQLKLASIIRARFDEYVEDIGEEADRRLRIAEEEHARETKYQDKRIAIYEALLNARLEGAEEKTCWLESPRNAISYVYRLSINPDKGELFTWDDPIKGTKAWERFESTAPKGMLDWVADPDVDQEGMSGGCFYNLIQNFFEEGNEVPGFVSYPKADMSASHFLRDVCGIKGLRHLDGPSARGEQDFKTYNYITFDMQDVTLEGFSLFGKWCPTKMYREGGSEVIEMLIGNRIRRIVEHEQSGDPKQVAWAKRQRLKLGLYMDLEGAEKKLTKGLKNEVEGEAVNSGFSVTTDNGVKDEVSRDNIWKVEGDPETYESFEKKLLNKRGITYSTPGNPNLFMQISRETVDKIKSGTALKKYEKVPKEVRPKYIDAHFTAGANIGELWQVSKYGTVEPDKYGNPYVEGVHKRTAYLEMGDELFLVKLTAKEYKKNTSSMDHLYVLEIESIDRVKESSPVAQTTEETHVQGVTFGGARRGQENLTEDASVWPGLQPKSDVAGSGNDVNGNGNNWGASIKSIDPKKARMSDARLEKLGNKYGIHLLRSTRVEPREGESADERRQRSIAESDKRERELRKAYGSEDKLPLLEEWVEEMRQSDNPRNKMGLTLAEASRQYWATGYKDKLRDDRAKYKEAKICQVADVAEELGLRAMSLGSYRDHLGGDGLRNYNASRISDSVYIPFRNTKGNTPNVEFVGNRGYYEIRLSDHYYESADKPDEISLRYDMTREEIKKEIAKRIPEIEEFWSREDAPKELREIESNLMEQYNKRLKELDGYNSGFSLVGKKARGFATLKKTTGSFVMDDKTERAEIHDGDAVFNVKAVRESMLEAVTLMKRGKLDAKGLYNPKRFELKDILDYPELEEQYPGVFTNFPIRFTEYADPSCRVFLGSGRGAARAIYFNVFGFNKAEARNPEDARLMREQLMNCIQQLINKHEGWVPRQPVRPPNERDDDGKDTHKMDPVKEVKYKMELEVWLQQMHWLDRMNRAVQKRSKYTKEERSAYNFLDTMQKQRLQKDPARKNYAQVARNNLQEVADNLLNMSNVDAHMKFVSSIVGSLKKASERLKRFEDGRRGRVPDSDPEGQKQEMLQDVLHAITLCQVAVSYMPKGSRIGVKPYLDWMEVFSEVMARGDTFLDNSREAVNAFWANMMEMHLNKTGKRFALSLGIPVDPKGGNVLDQIRMWDDHDERVEMVRDMISAYAEHRMDRLFDRLLTRINVQLEGYCKGLMEARIERIFAGLEPKTKAGEKTKKGVVSYEAFERFKKIKELMLKGKAEYEKEFEDAIKEYERLSADPDSDPEEVSKALKTYMDLKVFGHLSGKDLNETQVAFIQLQRLVRGEKEAWKAYNDEYIEEMRDLADDYKASVANRFGKDGVVTKEQFRKADTPATTLTGKIADSVEVVESLPQMLQVFKASKSKALRRFAEDISRKLATAGAEIGVANKRINKFVTAAWCECFGLDPNKKGMQSEVDKQITEFKFIKPVTAKEVQYDEDGKVVVDATGKPVLADKPVKARPMVKTTGKAQVEVLTPLSLLVNAGDSSGLAKLRSETIVQLNKLTAQRAKEDADPTTATPKLDAQIKKLDGILETIDKYTSSQVVTNADGTKSEQFTVRPEYTEELNGLLEALDEYEDARTPEYDDEGRIIAKPSVRAREFLEYTFMKDEGEGEALEMSKDVALYLILLSEQTDYQLMLARQGFSEPVITKLREFVGPEGIAFGYRMREYLQAQGRRISDVFQEEMGVPFPMVENYFPGRFSVKPGDQGEMMSLDDSMGGNITADGFLKKRVAPERNKANISLNVGACSVWRDNLSMTEHWLQTHELVKDLRTFLRQDRIQDYMKVEFGGNYVNLFKQWVSSLENMGRLDGNSKSQIDITTSEVYRYGALSVLYLKIESILRQLSGILNMWAGNQDLQWHEWIKGMYHTKNGGEGMTVADMLKSDYIKSRIDTTDDIHGAYLMRMMQNGHFDKFLRQTQQGMVPMGAVDAFINAVPATILYNAYYARAKKQGNSAETCEKLAWEEVYQAFDAGAQPMHPWQKSHYGNMSNSTVVGRAFTFMLSEQLGKVGLVESLIRSKQYGKASMVWLSFGVLNSLIGALIDYMKDDPDDWDERKLSGYAYSALFGMLGGIPILSEGFEEMLRSMGADVYLGSSARGVIDMRGFTRSVKKVAKMADDPTDHSLSEWTKEIGKLGRIGGVAGAMTGKTAGSALLWFTSLMNPLQTTSQVAERIADD